MRTDRLIEKQLKKSFGDSIPDDAALQKFIGLVRETYRHNETDRELLERSMDLSSEELMEANQKLAEESRAQQKILNSLKEAISVLLNKDENIDIREGQESTYMLELANQLKKLAQDQQEVHEQYRKAAISAEEANRAKTIFMSSISHELRTPLNAIIGFAQILQNDANLPQKTRSYVNTMHKSGIHLLNMINDILDISKIESGKLELMFEPFNVRDLLADVEVMFIQSCEKKNLNFTVSCDESVPDVIYSDGKRIKQVLINLVGNAIKYTRVGKVDVHVTADVTPDNSSCVLLFSIKDTGRGIPESQLKNIFEPFRQVKGFFSEGTGLGLAISTKIAELLEGSITAESKFGKGSHFTFRMVAETVAEKDIAKQESFTTITGIFGDKKWRALIVDDIQSNRAVVRALLENVGIECIETDNGEDVLGMTRIFKPDFILMDIMMPGVNGIVATNRVRSFANLSDVKIIALSATTSYGKREELLQCGFDEYISKPFREHHVFQVLEDVVGIPFIKKESHKHREVITDHHTILTDSGNWISELNQTTRSKLVNAIESQNFDQIADIVESLGMKDDVSKLLTKKAGGKDYLFFLSLSDALDV